MFKIVNTFGKKHPLRSLAQGYTFFIVFLFSCKGVFFFPIRFIFELNFLANVSRLYFLQISYFSRPLKCVFIGLISLFHFFVKVPFCPTWNHFRRTSFNLFSVLPSRANLNRWSIFGNHLDCFSPFLFPTSIAWRLRVSNNALISSNSSIVRVLSISLCFLQALTFAYREFVNSPFATLPKLYGLFSWSW